MRPKCVIHEVGRGCELIGSDIAVRQSNRGPNLPLQLESICLDVVNGRSMASNTPVSVKCSLIKVKINMAPLIRLSYAPLDESSLMTHNLKGWSGFTLPDA